MYRSSFALLALLALAGPCTATEDALIKTRDGATLSATVALPDPRPATRLSTILVFDIYTNPEAQKAQAESFAARGYAGVIADTRGKRLSPDKIEPYQHEAEDTHAVIDWIVKQPWSDGKVGMIGGSYSGFTAWAATKHKHPALKGIAVSAAAIPGFGLPMHNNVFLNANYQWAFYVTNNKLLDEPLNADSRRWWEMSRNWFVSGRPYREIDAVEGTPNPWLQRWLQHPAYDKYWQSMVPYQRDFAHVNIPVLTITGYYDDGQISALQYMKQHLANGRNPEHYLVIGPYDHLGTHWSKKPEVLREYTIDPVAQMDSVELKLQFMDYVLRGAPKPALLANNINYEVMGANLWRHAPSLGSVHAIPMRLYFSAQKSEGMFSLINQAPPAGLVATQEVDFTDRVKWHGFHSYPVSIVQPPLSYVTESLFLSQPFEAATVVTGSFTGELAVKINKKDFDLSITVYEAMQDGKLFHLGYALQRASYAEDPQKRHLLSPGKLEHVKFETSVVSRQMLPGSRLLVLVDANKNLMAQVNYGTGKDVSDESVKDAGEPLKIEIQGGSYFEIPLDNSFAVKPK
ncbi:MAG TPA: CocE/NonD family hydrolase [Steroidobacteraceae bacterium]|jgi:putative CocE/NonD family hydrolase|nr:CocE/NonD family hydrolase [Steroidobacteraceae bacterium]